MLIVVEGIVMCFVLLIVCVVGIANGPVWANNKRKDQEKLYHLQHCYVCSAIRSAAHDGLWHQRCDGFLGCVLANVYHSLDSGLV